MASCPAAGVADAVWASGAAADPVGGTLRACRRAQCRVLVLQAGEACLDGAQDLGHLRADGVPAEPLVR